MFTQNSPTQREMAHIRHHLYAGTQPSGGMLFFELVRKCDLMGDDGLRRLGRLFEYLRSKKVTLPQIMSRPNGKNFLLTVAACLVEHIAQRVDDVPIWLNFEESPYKTGETAVDAFTSKKITQLFKKKSSPKFAFSVVAQFGEYGICHPLEIVEEALSQPVIFEDYVQGAAQDILSKAYVNLLDEPNTICRNFLKKVRTGKLIDGTVAYRDLLERIHFDYSYESICQIDKVIAVIKRRERLGFKSYNRFVNKQPNQAMLYLLGCYIGMTAVTLAKTAGKWFNYDQMSELIGNPEFVFCMEHNQVMMLDGYMRCPFFSITNQLFDLDSSLPRNAQVFVDNVIASHSAGLRSFSKNVHSDRRLPPDWEAAMNLAGTLAASNMLRVSDGGDTCPMSLQYDPESNQINILSYMGGDLQQLMEDVRQKKGVAPFNLLSYDMYVNLPSGRTDGITIEVQVFDPPLYVQWIVPYRHASSYLGFAIYPLLFSRKEKCPDSYLDALAAAFYKAAQSITDPFSNMDYWASYYIDKNDIYEPGRMLSPSRPVAFDAEQSEIEMYPPKKK